MHLCRETDQSKNNQTDQHAKYQNDETLKKTAGIVKGAGIFNYMNKYVLKFAKTSEANCRVSIYDTKLKTWPVRFDKAHKGANYNHININHKVTGVRDPHLKLPAGGLTVCFFVSLFHMH